MISVPKGRLILVVDDDTTLVTATVRHLRNYWDMVAVDNVPDALKALAESKIEVVLTDWNMPHGGGKRVLDAALEMGIPVVVRSGGLAFRDPAMKGASAVLAKPSSTPEIDRALWRALSQAKNEDNIQ